MTSIEILEGPSALKKVAAEWETLVGDSFTSAFSQPGWYEAWIEAFPARKIAVITARDAGCLVGILPLSRNRTDFRGGFFKQTAPIARGDYQPPIVAPERLNEVLPAMLDAAFRYYGRGEFWWPNIPETDPGITVLRSYFKAKGLSWEESSERCPRAPLNGQDIETVEQGWPAKHRKDVRRCRKLLEKDHGPFGLWTPSSVEEGMPVLEEFFRVHDAKWLSQGWPGMFQNPANRRFYQAALRHLWGKGIHFSTVRCGAIDISYQFGFFSGGWLQWYRPSYRSEFHAYSPSKLHVALVFEEGCRNGWQGVDFLLGEEPYKLLWSHESLASISFQAGVSWSPAYLWFTRGKPYVRDKLAGDYFRAKAWLQKIRQKK
jgi:CelD/BcsL family acetyltransferase involved in cellulose biosynthesis